MSKRIVFFLFFIFILSCVVFPFDLSAVNSDLGPSSFTLSLYTGFFGNTVGANFEWGIANIPFIIGIGFAPLFIGEYAIRFGYHPCFGIKGLNIYANFTLGVTNLVFVPLSDYQVGLHLGLRYFFQNYLLRNAGVFVEGGWSRNLNYVKFGWVIRRKT